MLSRYKADIKIMAKSTNMSLIVGWILENPVWARATVFLLQFRHQCCGTTANDLSAEAVEGLALPLERVDDIHGGDGPSAGVLGVGDRVTDDVLKEDLEDTTGLFVDET